MVFAASKTMVDHAKEKGVDATWLPVAGGMHTDAWAQPEIVTKNGKPVSVILPIKKYQEMLERLEDAADVA